MAFGEPIISLDDSGIATVLGILGIGLITNGNTISLTGQKKGG
jgi:hypothetical protein